MTEGNPWSLLASLKRQCHKMNIFVIDLNILISTFCVCAVGFQSLIKAFQYHIQILTFYLLLRNLLLILKMRTETFLSIPLSVICRCSLKPSSHWLKGKCARINLSQAASSLVLQNDRRGFQ